MTDRMIPVTEDELHAYADGELPVNIFNRTSMVAKKNHRKVADES